MSDGYMGPGLWIQIQERFGPRMMEWFMALHMMVWGYVLIFSKNLFDQPAWTGFRGIFQDENFLGWLMVSLGVLRFGGLIVNGARKDVTPMIRQISAGVGCMIWTGISYCYAQGSFSTWLAVYPIFAIGELVNIHRAARDQGKARHGRTG